MRFKFRDIYGRAQEMFGPRAIHASNAASVLIVHLDGTEELIHITGDDFLVVTTGRAQVTRFTDRSESHAVLTVKGHVPL